MSITLNFRVVGMYFGSSNPDSERAIKVTVEQESPSVADVMKQVAFNVVNGEYPAVPVDSFTFQPSNPTVFDDCTGIATNWVQGPISPSSGRQLDPGTYVLEQNLNGNPEQVLQYYIFDENFQQINRDNVFIPFGRPLTGDLQLKDGYTIVWRLVGILSDPTRSARAASQALRAVKALKG